MQDGVKRSFNSPKGSHPQLRATDTRLVSMPRGSKPFVPLSSIKPISQALLLPALNQWRNLEELMAFLKVT